MKVRAAVSNDLVLWCLIALALVVLAATCLWTGSPSPVLPLTWLLAGAALVAECLPVEIERRGVVFTLSLPFVAAIALVDGATTAIVANAGTAALGMLFWWAVTRPRHRGGLPSALWNLAAAVVSAAAGGWALAAIGVTVPRSAAHAVAASLVFVGCYGVVNFLLATLCDARMKHRLPADNVFAILRISFIGFALYGAVAAGVGVLAAERLLWGIPIALIPLLALRAGLEFKAGSYSHYYETITALTLMLQRAHPYTHGHLQRVADYSYQVALRFGFSRAHAQLIREASVLHDIGKIAIDEEVLDKPARLTDEEMNHVRLHAELGAAILAPVKPFEAIVPWVRHHHERPDGRGYPDRMLDVEIPFESKIIAVADAFDAMTMTDVNGDRRAYREPMTVEEALAELGRCSGTQFDARVVAMFRDVVLCEAGA